MDNGTKVAEIKTYYNNNKKEIETQISIAEYDKGNQILFLLAIIKALKEKIQILNN